MESDFSLKRAVTAPGELKSEAGSKLGRDPRGERARKRDRRQRPLERDELEVDTFEHVEQEGNDG
jgi:hypothetical protein